MVTPDGILIRHGTATKNSFEDISCFVCGKNLGLCISLDLEGSDFFCPECANNLIIDLEKCKNGQS